MIEQTTSEAVKVEAVKVRHPAFHHLIFGFDRWLQRRYSVLEFSNHPDCLFRVQVEMLRHPVTLPDGEELPLGARVLTLHLWNEHVPLMPASGATLAWARRMNRCLDVSLRELAHWLASRPDLADIAVVRASAMFGTTEQADQVLRTEKRFGFELIFEPRPSLAKRLHWLGENILVSLMVLARNPVAFRFDSWRRGRVPTVMMRDVLMSRYGPGADAPTKAG